jgi:glyoxylase-like metal-dependent hydrolase (beta-lactamase superfamily II)
MTSELNYDVLISDLIPVAGTPIPNGDAPHWSPLSHTLIFGGTEAALVDPPITISQTEKVTQWVASHGRRLTAIYLTHSHADHWLGTSQLIQAFPEATVFAGATTAQKISADMAGGVPGPLWTTLFPGQLADDVRFRVQSVPHDGFTVDGHILQSIEVGHTDTDDTTILHMPSIGLVAAGDVVYNNVHLYLAEAADGGFANWHRALDVVSSLEPQHVVAGHNDRDRPDLASTIAETHSYLRAAEEILAATGARGEFFAAVTDRFPDRINAYTTWLSALRLFEN